MIKNYLLDTNILLHNPQSIYGFGDNNVWLCGTTLQELDTKKTAPEEVGYNARETCRILDRLRQQGNLLDGVKLANGGTLFIEPDGVNQELLPGGFHISVPDNRIISTCLYLNQGRLKNSPIILLTNDVSMRVNATICGVTAQEVQNDHIEESSYTGHTDIQTDSGMIDELYLNQKVSAKGYDGGLLENEFCTLHCGKQSGLSIYRDGQFHIIREQTLFGGIRPLNRLQTYAVYALTNPDIPLVFLEGPAGTAKTFLALAAGLTQSGLGTGKNKEDIYRKLLISRPNAGSSDPGFGYLPGDLSEKMAPLLASYTDNLEVILRGKEKEEDPGQIQMQMDDLFATGAIELCPLNFIRGRSLQDSFIICDEAQNATKRLIRDVVTRAGEGSKVIITGDERQVDAPTLDRRNNGLIYGIEHMKGDPLAAVIRFDAKNCVRSKLAEAAITRMT